MFPSKLLIGITILSFLQISCLRGAKEATSEVSGVESSSDFKSKEVLGEPIENQEHDLWKVDTEKTYKFTACLVSRSTKSELPSGQTFSISRPNKTSFQEKTNKNGCLVWNEKVAFNFTSDSVYIEKVRVIEGLGTHKGKETLRLAINPWMSYRSESGKEVIDLNYGNQVGNSLIKESEESLAGLFSRSSGRDLLIEPSPTLKVIPIKDVNNGKRVKIVLRMNPYIEPLKMNGSPVKTILTGGRFDVRAQIIGNYVGEDAKKAVLLTPELKAVKVTMTTSGLLSLVVDIPLTRRVSMGQVQLALKVDPLDAPFKLNPYEGLHNIGSFDELFSGLSIPQVEGVFSGKPFEYGKFVESTSNFSELKSANWTQDLPPVYYSKLEPRFVRVASGETSTDRTIIYRVTTKVTDSVSGKPKAFQPFKIVRKSDGSVVETTSDEEGRIRWMDKISHLYYTPEQYYFPKIEIHHVASRAVKKLALAINPWDEGWTFGADVRGNEQYYKDMSKIPVRSPLLMVDAFRYQTVRFRYVIDEFLTLNVKKAVVMALDPLVQRYTIKSGRQFEPLRDGIYLAKVALVKYYIDPFQNGTHLIRDLKSGSHEIKQVYEGGEARKGQYTTVIKKLLRVQAGRITTPLEFSMRDLRMMSIRSSIMVQLETIDERKLLNDNIIDSKLRELVDEYSAANSDNGSMSEEEREDFIREKQALFEEEHSKLKDIMAKELESLHIQRSEVSDLQYKRFEILSQLEDSVNDTSALRATENYRNNLNLPRDEFEKKIQKVRGELDSMHTKMQTHWAKWDADWKSSQTKLDDSGLLSIPKDNAHSEKSYFDYLGILNSFVADFGIGTVVGATELEKMQLNNYTANPAAPFVDLNLYRNKSGLKRRTFIGPCTLIENDNMSEMRPTDTIDEKYCERIDCSEEIYEPRQQADNSEFENSAHHDSLKPFASMQVDEVVDMHISSEERYKKEMDALSQRANFVKAFNVEYISLEDKPLKEFKNGCQFKSNENCFLETKENVTPVNDFLKQLAGEDLQQLIQRYFYVHPFHKMKKVNEEVVRMDSLEPLFERTKNNFSGPFLSKVKEAFNERPEYIARYAIGNAYARSARIYVKEKFNGKAPKEMSQETVRGWLKGGMKSLKLEDAVRICDVLSQQATRLMVEKGFIKGPQEYGFFNPAPRKTGQEYLLEKCFESVRYLPESEEVFFDGITFDRRNKILKTGSYEHISGKNMNINVGIDFGVSSFQESNSVASLGMNEAALLGLATVGVGAATANPIIMGAGVVAALGGIVIASKSSNDVDGVNLTQGTSVNAATFLVVQKAEMDIMIEEHEKCLTTQFSPEFIKGLKYSRLELKDNVNNKSNAFIDSLSRGFMICDGVISQKPEKIRENYYYVTQHFTAGDMLDDANLLNHVWLLSLRGKRDFNTFISLLKAKELNSKGEVISDGDIYDYSLSRLGKVYNQVIPTFPGMYSVQD